MGQRIWGQTRQAPPPRRGPVAQAGAEALGGEEAAEWRRLRGGGYDARRFGSDDTEESKYLRLWIEAYHEVSQYCLGIVWQ